MRKLSALLVSLLLLLASCGSSDSAESSDAEFRDVSGAASDTTEAMQDDELAEFDDGADAMADSDSDLVDVGDEAFGGAADTPVQNAQDVPPLQPVDIGRDIIYTATIDVAVEDLSAASQDALGRIEAMGGLLFGQTTNTQGTPRTVLIFKVAPQDFQAALQALTDVGELRDQNISTTDVTERVVDLQSQIITSEASVLRLRELLAGAAGLDQIAQLERELLDRETVLERLRGQLRTVQAQVALATITVTMTEIVPGPALSVAQTAYLGHDGGSTCGGDQSLSIDEGEPFTMCLEITNVGETFLTNFEIREEALKLKTQDFVLTEGSLDSLLAPDASLALFYEGTADKSFNGQAQVTARPVDAEGAPVGQGTVAGRSSASVSVAPDNSLPGFVSGFESGWAALTAVISAVVLGIAFMLPLLPLLVLAWFGARLLRRHLAARPAKPAAYTPPPPAPTRESVSAES